MNAAGWARGVVADWTLFLVRGLPDATARDRFDEIVSDLWEQQHAATAAGHGSVRIATAILLRAARGLPADLLWRLTTARSSALALGTRRPIASAKPWVPLTGVTKPFDQTNGLAGIDVDPVSKADEPDWLAAGVITSGMSIGPGHGV